jgi:ABC-type multidrug transport system, ATPase component
MIKAETLSRTYGSVKAVASVSFEIEHGEIVGLLGHNGAGKTTIMKMLTGYLEPSSGTARVDEFDVSNDRAAVQQQIGYLPENCPLYPEMLVVEHLEYAASLKGIPQEKVAERIRYSISKTKLADVALQPVSTLSRGYRQRLGVAQAILSSPKILILDEPTNGLDPSQILEMRALIKELSNTATVLISTHILQEVQAVCDRVIIINRGKKALDAKMAELRTANRLSVITNLAPAAAATIFNEVLKLKVVSHEEENERHTYILQLAGNGSDPAIDEAVAKVAKVLVEKGHKIFSIQPQIRDLETVFGEITAGGDRNVGASADQSAADGSENKGVTDDRGDSKAPDESGDSKATDGSSVESSDEESTEEREATKE